MWPLDFRNATTGAEDMSSTPGGPSLLPSSVSVSNMGASNAQSEDATDAIITGFIISSLFLLTTVITTVVYCRRHPLQDQRLERAFHDLHHGPDRRSKASRRFPNSDLQRCRSGVGSHPLLSPAHTRQESPNERVWWKEDAIGWKASPAGLHALLIASRSITGEYLAFDEEGDEYFHVNRTRDAMDDLRAASTIAPPAYNDLSPPRPPCPVHFAMRPNSDEDPIFIDPTAIPVGSTVYFDNWKSKTPLPRPSEVESGSFEAHSYLLKDGHYNGRFSQRVRYYPDLGLVVKYGRRTTIAEGQALWMIRKYCPEVPVPDVYGWIKEGEETFIYLSYIEGVTLQSRLQEFSDDELDQVVRDLKTFANSWRRLRLPEGEEFIGSPDRGPMREQLWWNASEPPSSALPTVKDFNDAFLALGSSLPSYPDHEFYRSIRSSFPDDGGIRFTHTDLAACNILVSQTSAKVVGIIDWQESGWYPEFWDLLKMKYHADGRWYDCLERHFSNLYAEAWDGFCLLLSTGVV
ncbi:hypothetical protein NMY22_g2407 [Coprinellus aureogranulatus]|nr:hypothetical protein NMY22_g2407 [Coprinellus aureogranulatus]